MNWFDVAQEEDAEKFAGKCLVVDVMVSWVERLDGRKLL